MNVTFSDFFSAGSSLQFVTSDLQTSYRNLSFSFLSLYSFNFLLYKGGLLSTSHVNFSMSPTIDIAVWIKTQGLCTLLQLASSCLVASALGQTETWASCRYQQHICCLGKWVRPQQAATFLLPQKKSCQCARSRIKQCSPSGQLNSWTTKVAIARLALG